MIAAVCISDIYSNLTLPTTFGPFDSNIILMRSIAHILEKVGTCELEFYGS